MDITTQKKLDNLDLTEIKIKLTMPNDSGGFNWPENAAQEAILEYIKFLKTTYEYFSLPDNQDEKPSPDPIVDIVWHTHILFTQKYHDDCKKIFGHYLHHQPLI